jgi:lysozyme
MPYFLLGLALGLLVVVFLTAPKTKTLPAQIIIQTAIPLSCPIATPIPTPVPLTCPAIPIYARKTSQLGLNFISQYEGFSNAAYLDFLGNCTVGFGHKIRDGACKKGDWPLYVSDEQGVVLLEDDVSKVDYQIYKAGWNLNQNEWDAISSTLFNLGWPNFILTPIYSTLQDGDLTKVPDAINQTICCVTGLITRRAAEAQLFQDGIY